MAERDNAWGEHQLAVERLDREWALGSLQRLRLFFVGLVFAMLSYSLQVDFDKVRDEGQLVYSAAWGVLLICGGLALRESGWFVRQDLSAFKGLSSFWRFVMSASFFAGLVLLAVAKWVS